jgi:hypothetical protein
MTWRSLFQPVSAWLAWPDLALALTLTWPDLAFGLALASA